MVHYDANKRPSAYEILAFVFHSEQQHIFKTTQKQQEMPALVPLASLPNQSNEGFVLIDQILEEALAQTEHVDVRYYNIFSFIPSCMLDCFELILFHLIRVCLSFSSVIKELPSQLCGKTLLKKSHNYDQSKNDDDVSSEKTDDQLFTQQPPNDCNFVDGMAINLSDEFGQDCSDDNDESNQSDSTIPNGKKTMKNKIDVFIFKFMFVF